MTRHDAHEYIDRLNADLARIASGQREPTIEELARRINLMATALFHVERALSAIVERSPFIGER